MYLTRFRIHTARIGARRLLASPQALHAAVMASFPVDPAHDGSGARVLWRLDRNAKHAIVLYVVSPTRPDLTHLVEQAGWPTAEDGWRTYNYQSFLDRLSAGDTWAFRLTANPVHSIRRKEGEPTKRTAHVTTRHQIGWLVKHQHRCGFQVLERPACQRLLPEGDEYDVDVRDRRELSFAKAAGAGGRQNKVTLATATFDGRLRVTDPEALRRTLTAGLGKAKAYGCGLMTLAPVR